MLDSIKSADKRPRPLSDIFPTASAEALDLMRQCFQFNPNKRISGILHARPFAHSVSCNGLFLRLVLPGCICCDSHSSAADALRHPYVARFHNPEDEPACPRILRIQIDDNTK